MEYETKKFEEIQRRKIDKVVDSSFQEFLALDALTMQSGFEVVVKSDHASMNDAIDDSMRVQSKRLNAELLHTKHFNPEPLLLETSYPQAFPTFHPS